MSQPNEIPFEWSPQQYQSFGLVPQVTPHRYHDLPLFDPDYLIPLLHSYPRRNLQVYTMGTDPTKHDEWRHVDVPDNITGEALWEAVNRGRLWYNLTHIENNQQQFASLIKGMYEHLGKRCPHLDNPRGTHSALLISSPGAQVYYHLDAEPNMLWHMRGEKDVWIYPSMDTRIVPQDHLENIYSGEVAENLPYDPSFDQYANRYRLKPGDAASWPHNGPHRVVNIDLNVSLATSYYTSAIYKRQYVQLANRFLLRNLGIRHRSMNEEGIVASAKRMTYRTLNKIRPFERHDRSSEYLTDLQVDPNSSTGYSQVGEPRLASFSKLRHQREEVQQSTQSPASSGTG